MQCADYKNDSSTVLLQISQWMQHQTQNQDKQVKVKHSYQKWFQIMPIKNAKADSTQVNAKVELANSKPIQHPKSSQGRNKETK
jgi:hypothetical protein